MLLWWKTRRAVVLCGTAGVLLVALFVHWLVPATGKAVRKAARPLSIPNPVTPQAAQPPTPVVPQPLPPYPPMPMAGTVPPPPDCLPDRPDGPARPGLRQQEHRPAPQ